MSLSSNGAEALALVLENPERFDLVLTDQAMPILSGAELAAQLLERFPKLPIIISTGYSESLSPEEARRLGIRECLTKPVDLPFLARTILRLLRSQPNS